MIRQGIFHSAFRRNTLTLAIASCLVSGAALAQTDDEAALQLEEVKVTGSRISRDTFITPAPVTVLDSDAIEVSGAINIGDLLNELPALGTTFGSQNSDRFIGTAGLNLLDLRRLGTARTLVLVNGQRHVPASIGSSAVDVNSIPSSLIERVEVITGGASAVYGADAVTGVVNFILKDDFQGVELKTQTGRSGDGGLDRSSVDLTAGFNVDNGRGNAVVSLEYSTVGSLTAADRGILPTRLVTNPLDGDTTDANGNVIHDGIPDEIVTPNAGLSIITPGGYFSVGGTNFVFDAPNSFRPANPGTNFGSSECGDGCDFLDLTSFVNFSTPQDRYAFNLLFNYELAPEHDLKIEGKYVNSQASGTGQPHFNFFNLSIAADNAFIPGLAGGDLGQILTDNNVSAFNLNRFNLDGGLRAQDNERQTSRILVGAAGPLTSRLDYDVNLIFGRTTSEQLDLANRVNERFFAAADAVIDPNTGQTVCRHTLDPTSINTSLGRSLSSAIVGACVPVNVFGDGAISQEAIDYFTVTSVRNAKLEQSVVNGVISGSLMDLPAGPLGFAGGFEYREESSDDLPDPIDGLGLTFLNVLQPESGEYDVSEVFAEFRFPLLTNAPFAKELSVDVAGRYSDYSTIGDTFTWKAGLEWAPLDWARFRGTYSEAVRAPNIGELFGPQNQTFFNVLDPCSDDRLDLGRNGRATREANCRALGVPAGFDARDEVTREGLAGGNPGLAEEESESLTLGMVFQPLDGLSFAVDYWDISIDDTIAVAGAQDILNRCVDSEAGIGNEFCQLITRDATNNISLIVQTQQNIAALEANGVDLEGAYSFDAFDGAARVRVLATVLDELNTFPFQSDPESEEQEAGGLGDPELSGQIDLSWARGPLAVNWSTRYIESMLRIDLEDFAVNPDAQDPLTTGDTFYSDLNLSYSINDNWNVSFGVDNILDEDLPLGLTGTGAGSGIFDNVGRFYYGSVTLRLGE